MKIFYNYDYDQILTEEEAKKNIEEDVLSNSYNIWEFLTNNYSPDEIMEKLPQNFLENVIEDLIESELENPSYFLVREIPD